MKVEKDFEDLLRLFNKHRVRYCIVGSYAVAFYARPRYTKDMDVLVDPAPENAKRIVLAINDFGFRSLNLQDKDFAKKNNIVQLGYEPVRVDIITSIEGLRFEDVWKKRKTGHYGKQKAIFIGINQLVKSKRISRRKQDKADLEILSKVKI